MKIQRLGWHWKYTQTSKFCQISMKDEHYITTDMRFVAQPAPLPYPTPIVSLKHKVLSCFNVQNTYNVAVQKIGVGISYLWTLCNIIGYVQKQKRKPITLHFFGGIVWNLWVCDCYHGFFLFSFFDSLSLAVKISGLKPYLLILFQDIHLPFENFGR